MSKYLIVRGEPRRISTGTMQAVKAPRPLTDPELVHLLESSPFEVAARQAERDNAAMGVSAHPLDGLKDYASEVSIRCGVRTRAIKRAR